jgi:hypothetical protein
MGMYVLQCCVEECPVNISPVDNYGYATLFSHGAKCCTNALNAMMTNIENNGAPWQYNQQDRLNWKDEN